ncbi:MAG TPA: copper chaperone PCu(A)C [Aestuariivirga sp.]|nr:copper chaperone PCu(A)C [Aestuariivirga sp.]
MRIFSSLALAGAVALAALTSVPAAFAGETMVGNIMLMDIWSKKSPAGANVSAGFMAIMNHGKDADRLVKATAEISPNVQIHTMVMDGDVMKMEELKNGLEIPAGQTVMLKPGSFHIMFMDMPGPQPEVGKTFKGTLTFEKAGTVDVVYDVKAPQ